MGGQHSNSHVFKGQPYWAGYYLRFQASTGVLEHTPQSERGLLYLLLPFPQQRAHLPRKLPSRDWAGARPGAANAGAKRCYAS